MKKFVTVLVIGMTLMSCSSDDDSINDSNNDNGDNEQSLCEELGLIYLADNGITIKACDDAIVGDTGVINGITYTVVDENTLREMVADERDVTKVVTTKVTDMSELFFTYVDYQIDSDFNQDISSWDVSNVTYMDGMFMLCYWFNQDISSWDVSSVTDMRSMFATAIAFNQPIGDWDVSSVTNMTYMFRGSGYFNQDISSWDVSNATSMRSMFSNSSFNQPIGDWDVGNVRNMISMFDGATYFNQTLSGWYVENVTSCAYFNRDTPQWTLPKPNLIYCLD
jgi:surface protein